jgi:teichuronic acid exporter
MADSLKNKTAQGLFWAIINNGTTQVLNAVFGIFLGRILSPGEYGIMTYIVIFSALAANLQSSGFTSYLINMKHPEHSDYNAVFWFNILMGGLLYTILFFCSPLIASFYHQPVLVWLSRFVFLGFFISSFGIAMGGIMTRRLMIRENAIIGFFALLASGTTGITLAILGFSYWSLAWQQIIYVTVITFGRFHYVDWRPTLHIDLRPIRKMLPFSINLLFTMIINTLSTNIMSVIIGILFTKEDLGNYGQAYKWDNMAYSLVFNTTQQVAQPVFAAINDQRERQVGVFRKMIRFTVFLSFPAMLGLALVAHEFIFCTVGPNWAATVPLLQILCISGAFFPLYSLYQGLIIGRGRSDINLWCNVAQLVIQIALVLLFHSWGITVMVIIYSAFNILWLLAWQAAAHHTIGLRLSELLRDILPFFVISVAVMGLTWLITRSIQSNVLLLVTRIPLAALLYVAALKICHAKILDECIAFAKQKMHKH